ncbi:MAG: MFS transporter [Chloroflexi bacterium]|nr:MFS transporter [Chloroflexota bacterium]
MWHQEIRRHLRFNFIVNVLDGGFFGVGVGFASTVTVIPLFINTLTDSKLLIGLIVSLHTIGWQLPQLLTATRVARLQRYKPMVLWMTIHERFPYLGLALLALLLPALGKDWGLPLAFILVAWQALGAGLTANPWQSMVGKIMPPERVGTFFGTQSAAANLLASGSAVVAGFLLQSVAAPYNFALCFLLAGAFMAISYIFLALTREPEHPAVDSEEAARPGWNRMVAIVRQDANFRWFLVARMLSQVAWIAINFYTVYAVRQFNLNEETIGVLTGLLMICQAIANPVLGWIGDHWGHRTVYAVGALMMTASAALALFAPAVGWLYAAFALAGFSNAAVWSIAMSFTLEFGTGSEKPLYIGLANTLIAPVTLLAPIVAGGLADAFGFPIAFGLSVITGLATALVLQFVVRDPQPRAKQITVPPAAPVTAGD